MTLTMRQMRFWNLVFVAGIVGCGGSGGCSIGCGFDAPGQPPADVVADSAMPHGDHSPHHGGVVMMKGDMHYEVVLDPGGHHRLYFTDATRADLPASTAARASITLMRPNEAPEGISLQIDESGESWVGSGRPVADPAATTARVSYTLRGEEPYWIDLPFVAKADPAAADPHRRQP